MIKWLLSVVLIFNVLVSYAQVNLFISTKGNDKNSGSIENPFKTLSKGLEVAAKFKKKDVRLYLRSGKYYLDTTIIVSSKNFELKSLLIAAYENEKVSLSGGKSLNLKWEAYKNGILKAQVSKGSRFERLYINGKLKVLARYPNYDSTARVFNGTAADAISKDKVKDWKNPNGAYVHALHSAEWGGFHYKVEGVNETGELKLTGGWQNNRPSAMHARYRFIENVFEELDAENEWYLDKASSTLYFYPQKGLNINNVFVETSNIKNSIELIGTANKSLRNIEIKNIHFVDNERSFWETKEPLVRSDWTIYRGGALLLEGTENCKITDCVFTNLGGNAIMLSNYNKNNIISGNHIYNIGASAICLIGDTKSLRSASFRYQDYVPYNEMDKTPGPLTNNYPQQCKVIDNLLHNVGQIEKQATGVEIEVASEITVSNNSIYNTPRAGINIGDGGFGGHVIAYNDVFNTVLETGDHGAFNSWGRDRFWASNRKYMDSLVAAHPELILLDAQKQTTIHDNRFRCDHGWDIDLDDGSTNYSIYNNVCLNGGLKLREGFYRIVKNNILINNTFHPHVWFKNSGDVFKHNIVMRKYAPIGIKNWGNAIDSNLFLSPMDLAFAKEKGTDSHSVIGGPLFLNPELGNYSVKTNSAALSIGFKNFRMDKFGVQKSSLKSIALKPDIPELVKGLISDDNQKTVDFMGGKIKSVNSVGERSAYGLPNETGVVVISSTQGLFNKSKLQPRDVIVQAGGKKVETVADLQAICSASVSKPGIPLKIYRNQVLQDVTLLMN